MAKELKIKHLPFGPVPALPRQRWVQTKINTKLIAGLLLAGSCLFAAPRVTVGIGFGVGVPAGRYYAPAPVYYAPAPAYVAPAYLPPAPVAVVPPIPGPGYTWTAGYWYGYGPHRVWRSGYWAAPHAYVGVRYTPLMTRVRDRFRQGPGIVPRALS